jgi:cytochrome oxidase Cu insertion factor (SCO1/SenC/PrrC family)
MKSRTVIPIGTVALMVVLALVFSSCAVSTVQPSPEPVTQLSPLFPTAATVILPSPLQTPTPVAVAASSPLPTPTAGVKLAPDFSLPRENGQTVRLSDFRDKSSVVLVFYRGQT